MARESKNTDLRLIEAGFPCHQVGAETQRERDTGKAPPVNRLHVWWARRPLTPSRAAILASLLPADTDPDWFLRQLGIEKVEAIVNGRPWTLVSETLLKRIRSNGPQEWLAVDRTVLKALQKEQIRRGKNREVINKLCDRDPSLNNHPVVKRWSEESKPIPAPLPEEGDRLPIRRVSADPAHVNERIEFRKLSSVRRVLGTGFSWDEEDLYGYGRAFQSNPTAADTPKVILDPTAGGGSILFEALRLGHHVIANELNPVATVILNATLDYPLRYGIALANDIEYWGNQIANRVHKKMDLFFPEVSSLPLSERARLDSLASETTSISREFDQEHIVDYLYCRQVTCPHCGGEAPLLNTSWLAKEGDKWGVRIVSDGKQRNGTVRFETYRVKGNRGPNGEDPNFATVSRGVGTCIHCKQAIPADEIKAQARGESPHGKWQDRLYCVVAVRYEPKLDKNGNPRRYKSGKRKGQIVAKKVRFFRPPNADDLEALRKAEVRLQEKWDEWERERLIPTESIPDAHKTKEPLRVGMTRWCDMFTPRQLLGHLTLVEELNRLKPKIVAELGEERGRALVTYLQFIVDKCVDYNSRQTRWIPQRCIVSGTFGRHDYSVKWTFGEMVFSGPNSGIAWALSQIIDAYRGIAELVQPVHERHAGENLSVSIQCGTAAHTDLSDGSVDLICMDPPYYNNVQYAELSDYYYVWQKRTLSDLYPDLFRRRLTNKTDEAVANPARDGSSANAVRKYEDLMREIFAECNRVLKDNGVMTIMFTHKTQEAWEALVLSLIESGWVISASFPVESEFTSSMHQKNMAAAASSVFLACRKRTIENPAPAVWSGFGGTGVAQEIRQAVREGLEEFKALKLNPVDEMVASYGRALRILSENWPVWDGDEPVRPKKAMTEASAVVAQYQVARLTNGRLQVTDLNPEGAMSLTLYGIFGLNEFPYDEALNLSRSLHISLESRAGGYTVKDGVIGINDEKSGNRRGSSEEDGYYAPLVRRGSKLRLVLPEERNPKRLENPQTEWDVMQGVIQSYREGDVPVARAYLKQHAEGREQLILDLLSVWAEQAPDEQLRKEGNQILFGLR